MIERAGYRLDVAEHGRTARLEDPAGAYLATLRLFAAVDRVGRPDETLEVLAPVVVGDTVTVERRSTAWERAGLTLTCADEQLEVRAWVEGSGEVADTHLLAGRSLLPGQTDGYLPSGSSFRTLFTPNPSGALPPIRPEAEGAVIGVLGDSEPGRQHWLFTPAPLYLALSHDDEAWTALWLAGAVDELDFVQLRYAAAAGGFAVRLEHEGHKRVEGTLTTPALVIRPGVGDPYEGLRVYRADLVERGLAPAPAERAGAPWWREPIFCGWGAQCNLARGGDGIAADYATQESYERFLDELAGHGLAPGTVTIDDKWQSQYGTCTPDPAKWPDLAGFIRRCHERGQRVLLWWKAWDAEGIPPELCVRNPDGVPVAFDPSNPDARAFLADVVRTMLAPGGLDADGLKTDFTARTPSGAALDHHGPAWGIALLHQLLETVYAAAKEAKPDALIVTHTPHPSFVDVTDMIRLNDMLLTDAAGPLPPVLPQMRYRADVVRAACPEVPIDTDDWSVPDLATWREYLAVKLDFGVPALYYSTHVDSTGEAFGEEDYAALREVWERWREQSSSA